MPTSRIVVRAPLVVRGGWPATSESPLLKLSLGGRWRDGGSGEVGSFLTIIFGRGSFLLDSGEPSLVDMGEGPVDGACEAPLEGVVVVVVVSLAAFVGVLAMTGTGTGTVISGSVAAGGATAASVVIALD